MTYIVIPAGKKPANQILKPITAHILKGKGLSTCGVLQPEDTLIPASHTRQLRQGYELCPNCLAITSKKNKPKPKRKPEQNDLTIISEAIMGKHRSRQLRQQTQTDDLDALLGTAPKQAGTLEIQYGGESVLSGYIQKYLGRNDPQIIVTHAARAKRGVLKAVCESGQTGDYLLSVGEFEAAVNDSGFKPCLDCMVELGMSPTDEQASEYALTVEDDLDALFADPPQPTSLVRTPTRPARGPKAANSYDCPKCERNEPNQYRLVYGKGKDADDRGYFVCKFCGVTIHPDYFYVDEDTLKVLSTPPEERPVISTIEETDCKMVNEAVGHQGLRWVINQALECEGISKDAGYIIGVILDMIDPDGSLPYTGYQGILYGMATLARKNNHEAFGIIIASAYHEITGRRVRGY